MSDPREPNIPTRAEFANLPRWARVAFAARCARRVQPLFLASWPNAPKEHVEALDRAITLGERSAADAAARSAAARSAATAAADAAAAYAARSAATDAADAARSAAAAAAARARAEIARVIRNDFDGLLKRATAEKWTNRSPVPPEVFGPMWPEGEPKGWPWRRESNQQRENDTQAPDPAANAGRPLSLYFDLNDFTLEEVAEMIENLSALYKSIGGDRLVIEDVSVMDPAAVLQPTGGEP